MSDPLKKAAMKESRRMERRAIYKSLARVFNIIISTILLTIMGLLVLATVLTLVIEQ